MSEIKPIEYRACPTCDHRITTDEFKYARFSYPCPRCQGSTVDNMVPFLAAKNLKEFISKDLEESTKPQEFLTKKGAKAFGYRAELLPQVCEVYLQARDNLKLHPSQAKTCKSAEIIMRGLAQVGITALVDEATGYQDVRARDALAIILEQYIADEHRKWTECFPEKFYKEMFRLNIKTATNHRLKYF